MNTMVPSLLQTTPLELHPYLSINPQEISKKNNSQIINNKLIAIISLVAIGIITIVGVVLAASLGLPFLIPAIILFGSSLATPIYRNCKKSLNLAKQQALEANGIAQKVKEFQKKSLSKNDSTSFMIEELKINPYMIKEIEEFYKFNPENPYRPLDYPIGRFLYWSQQAKKYETEIHDLESKIQEDQRKLSAPETSPKQAEELKIAWLQLNLDKHRIEEELYLPAKLAAAYDLHVIVSPKDTHTPNDFGSPIPSSYLDSMTIHDPKKQPYYYFTDQHRTPISKDWLLTRSINQIARYIFDDSAIDIY